MHPSGRYLAVGLSKNGKQKTITIHQLVAREWIPNPENKRCVDHRDGDPTNNHHENLRYATHTENSRNQKKSNQHLKRLQRSRLLQTSGEVESES
jgi:hypothetical protein